MKYLKLLLRIILSILPFILFTIIMLIFNPLEIYFSELNRLKYWLFVINLLYLAQYNIIYEVKNATVLSDDPSTKSMMVTGPTNTTTMAICCIHHIAELAPILGLSLISTFVYNIQEELLLVSVIINLIMLYLIIRRLSVHTIDTHNPLLKLITNIKLKSVKMIMLAIFFVSLIML